MPSNKLKRHVRQEAAPSIDVQLRDVDICETVWRHRALKQSHLQGLHFGSRPRAEKRLRKLYDNQLLERKFLALNLGEGRSPTIYVLDRKGAELLRAERGLDIKWYNTSKDLTDLFLRHTLAINDVLVSAHEACKTQGFKFDHTTDWQPENEVKANPDKVQIKQPNGQRVTILIQPDSIFTLAANGRRHRFFLEVDRGTEAIEKWKTKVRAYIAYHESGQYEKRYQQKGLRILTVVTTKYSGVKRIENLKAATESVGGQHRFWFALASDITSKTMFDAPIWTVATREGKSSLITAGETVLFQSD